MQCTKGACCLWENIFQFSFWLETDKNYCIYYFTDCCDRNCDAFSHCFYWAELYALFRCRKSSEPNLFWYISFRSTVLHKKCEYFSSLKNFLRLLKQYNILFPERKFSVWRKKSNKRESVPTICKLLLYVLDRVFLFGSRTFPCSYESWKQLHFLCWTIVGKFSFNGTQNNFRSFEIWNECCVQICISRHLSFCHTL